MAGCVIASHGRVHVKRTRETKSQALDWVGEGTLEQGWSRERSESSAECAEGSEGVSKAPEPLF